jgi:hypothetical protein
MCSGTYQVLHDFAGPVATIMGAGALEDPIRFMAYANEDMKVLRRYVSEDDFREALDRRELLKMLKALAPGDVVTVTRIDRLARSTFDLFAIVKQIVERDPIRTRTAEGRSRAQKRGEHYGPAPEIDGGAEGRGPPTTGAGRDASGTRAQLRRGKEHDFKAIMLRKLRSQYEPTYRLQATC